MIKMKPINRKQRITIEKRFFGGNKAHRYLYNAQTATTPTQKVTTTRMRGCLKTNLPPRFTW